MTNETLTITGYEVDGNCEHCGRALRHCIRIDDGRIVGATCFDKILTKPRMYQGKPFRIGSENVIRYAKIAQRYNKQARELLGVDEDTLTFWKA